MNNSEDVDALNWLFTEIDNVMCKIKSLPVTASSVLILTHVYKVMFFCCNEESVQNMSKQAMSIAREQASEMRKVYEEAKINNNRHRENNE